METGVDRAWSVCLSDADRMKASRLSPRAWEKYPGLFDESCYLTSILTPPSHRRKGPATALIKEMRKKADEKGLKMSLFTQDLSTVRAQVFSKNEGRQSDVDGRSKYTRRSDSRYCMRTR